MDEEHSNGAYVFSIVQLHQLWNKIRKYIYIKIEN